MLHGGGEKEIRGGGLNLRGRRGGVGDSLPGNGHG